MCSEVFGGKTLSTTMNQEESVARGCALQAAILSPLYKVREFRVEDTCPFSINVSWMGHAQPAAEPGNVENGEGKMMDSECAIKSATVFPAGTLMDVLKTLTFFRKKTFEIKAEYADEAPLLPMTPKQLGSWTIEVPEQTEPKKIKVRVRLTLHGTFALDGAQMVEELEGEEAVGEAGVAPGATNGDVAMKPAEGNGAARANGGPSNEANGQEGGSEKLPDGTERKAEAVEPNGSEVKKKKRVKRTDLKVAASGTPGLSKEQLQKLTDAEAAMQTEMREIIETNGKRNDLESYILNMRSKIEPSAALGEYISPSEREAYSSELTKAEDWLYDNFEATKAMYIEKTEEVRKVGDAVAWRCKEFGMRPEWIQAVTGTINNYRSVAQKPGDKFGHVPAGNLVAIIASCNECEKWLSEMKAKQDGLQKHDKPVLLCAEMEKRSQELARMADEILKQPKPGAPQAARTLDVEMGSPGTAPARKTADMEVD